MDDLALLQAYGKEDDESAFGQLVQRHLSLVYGVAFRDLKDHHLTEELCQNVFVALGRSARKGTSIRSIPAWLYGVTRKQIAFTMRTEKRRKAREHQAAELAAMETYDGGSPASDLMPCLQDCLTTLSVKDQTALFLRFYEGRSMREVGQCLGVQEKAAQKRVERAIERLRNLLSKRKFALSSGMLGTQLFTAGAAAPPSNLATSIAQSALQQLSVSGSGWLTTLFTASVAKLAVLSVVVLGLSLPAISKLRDLHSLYSSPSTLRTSASAPSSQVLSTHATSIRIDDIEAIYRLPDQEREAALKRLGNYLNRRTSNRDYLTDLFTRWSRLDPMRNAHELVILFQNHQKDDQRSEILGELLDIPVSAAMMRDRDAALAWIAQLPRINFAEAYAFEAMLKHLAETDLPQAYERLRNRPYNRDRAFAILSEAIARHLMKDALALLDQFPDDEAIVYTSNLGETQQVRQEAGRSKAKLLEVVLPILFERDSQQLAQWIIDQPPSERTSSLIGHFVHLWGREEPEQAAKWTLLLPNEEKLVAAVSLARGWAEHAPINAMAWCETLGNEPFRWPAAEAAFTTWLPQLAPSENELAREAIERYAQAPEAEKLFIALAEHLPIEESYPWAKSLSAGVNRSESLQRVFYKLGQESPPDGKRWLKQMSPSEQSLMGYTFGLGWLIGGGRKDLKNWKATLSQEGLLFYAVTRAEVDLLASINPKLVAARVHQLPKDARRDPIMMTLIARTIRRSESAAKQALEWIDGISDSNERTEALRQVNAALAHIRTRPPGVVLPEGQQPNLRRQSLDELRERLDVLSSMPVSAALSQ